MYSRGAQGIHESLELRRGGALLHHRIERLRRRLEIIGRRRLRVAAKRHWPDHENRAVHPDRSRVPVGPLDDCGTADEYPLGGVPGPACGAGGFDT